MIPGFLVKRHQTLIHMMSYWAALFSTIPAFNDYNFTVIILFFLSNFWSSIVELLVSFKQVLLTVHLLDRFLLLGYPFHALIYSCLPN